MADICTDLRSVATLGAYGATHAPTVHPNVRIGLKVSGKILFVDPREIIAVHASRNYVSLQMESESYFVRESISHMEEKLRNCGFIRINHSALVNGFFVEEVRPQHSTGEYFVRVKGGQEYTATRTYKKNLSSLAVLWIGGRGFEENPNMA